MRIEPPALHQQWLMRSSPKSPAAHILLYFKVWKKKNPTRSQRTLPRPPYPPTPSLCVSPSSDPQPVRSVGLVAEEGELGYNWFEGSREGTHFWGVTQAFLLLRFMRFKFVAEVACARVRDLLEGERCWSLIRVYIQVCVEYYHSPFSSVWIYGLVSSINPREKQSIVPPVIFHRDSPLAHSCAHLH